MKHPIIFRMQDDFYTDSIALWIGQKQGDQLFQGKLTFEPYEPGLYAEPTLRLPSDSDLPDQMKQALKTMGRLHNADQASVEALKYHLEDMRKFAGLARKK